MNAQDAERRRIELLTAADRLAVSSSPDWRAFLEALKGVSAVYSRMLLASENSNIIHHRQGYALALDNLVNELSNPRELAEEAKKRLAGGQKRTTT